MVILENGEHKLFIASSRFRRRRRDLTQHIRVEQRRRGIINSNLVEIRQLVPTCPPTASKVLFSFFVSRHCLQGSTLQHAVAYIRNCKAQVAFFLKEVQEVSLFFLLPIHFL